MKTIKNEVRSRKITHIFISGKVSSTLIIPVDMARKHGLDKPIDVILEDLENGIFIKKLVL